MMNAEWKSRVANAVAGFHSAFCILTSAFLLLDDGQHVFLAHDHELFAVEFDFGSGVAGEDDFVAFLDVDRGALAAVQALAFPDAQHLPAARLFLGGVRQDDSTLGFALSLDALDEDL